MERNGEPQETMTKQIPRVVVCGAVDDGKSTLIGRLLASSGSIPKDEAEAARTADGGLDFSRLTDGLQSEREQGITIDVAYRYLKLADGGRALLADSPGHEQYTRNMAVAAATANVALLVVDAVRGIREQTIRHAVVCKLMGVKSFVVAINKIDAVTAPADRVAELSEELTRQFQEFPNLHIVPVSGLTGENVAEGADSLLTVLSSQVNATVGEHFDRFRMPVQNVVREGTQRYYAGRITSGEIAVGDTVEIWPSGTTAVVASLYNGGEAQDSAHGGQSVSIQLDREVSLSRGDILVRTQLGDSLEPENATLPVSRAHLVDLVWLDTEALDPAASYVLRAGPFAVPARVQHVRYRLDLSSLDEVSARTLGVNDVGRVEITADRPVFLDKFSDSRDTGGFILCERVTGATVAAGMAIHPVQRESEVTRHDFTVTREQRERLNGIQSGLLWLTGLPGSGKSTIADHAEKLLFEQGIRAYVIDGDTVRQTLSEDLGFSPADRRENVRRVARTAQLMMDAGLIVIVSLVSPFRDDRDAARELFARTDFAEVFVDTPLEVCQQRDPKGLYRKAASSGKNTMTGIGQPYEAPLNPELHLDGKASVEANAQVLVEWIMRRRIH